MKRTMQRVRTLLAVTALTDEQLVVADFDGNGTLATADVRAILISVLDGYKKRLTAVGRFFCAFFKFFLEIQRFCGIL